MTEFHSVKDLNSMTLDQLQTLLAQRREQMRHLRFQVASREVKNHRQLRFSRREIARIETVLKQKQAITA